MKQIIATVKAAGSDDDFPGMFEALASTTSLDRDGEVVAKGAFEPLPDRVPIHVDHRMDSEGLVGTGRPSYTASGALKVTGTFAGTPRAQIIRQLVREGHLNAMSVGFFAAQKREVDKTPTIVKAELLEVSFVTVPSNRDTRVLVGRNYGTRHPTNATVAVAKARASIAVATLALLDADEAERRSARRKSSPQQDAREIVASAEALLRRLKGTR